MTIGDDHCTNVDVTMNSISCKPPTKEPKDSLENKPRVRVRDLNRSNCQKNIQTPIYKALNDTSFTYSIKLDFLKTDYCIDNKLE